jgi:hypothetical protein
MNVSALGAYADNVTFILQGDERDEEIAEAIRKIMPTFDRSVDVIIPAGRVIASFILGYMLREFSEFYIGVYSDKQYSFLKIYPTELDRMMYNDVR